MQFRNRYVFQTATDPANKVLMGIHIRVEPSDRSRGTYFSDQVLAFKKLQSAIDGGLRETRELLAQPVVDRLCRWMRKVASKRPIYCQSLRGDTNASRTADLLEFQAPAVHFIPGAGSHTVAVNYHLQLIII